MNDNHIRLRDLAISKLNSLYADPSITFGNNTKRMSVSIPLNATPEMVDGGQDLLRSVQTPSSQTSPSSPDADNYQYAGYEPQPYVSKINHFANAGSPLAAFFNVAADIAGAYHHGENEKKRLQSFQEARKLLAAQKTKEMEFQLQENQKNRELEWKKALLQMQAKLSASESSGSGGTTTVDALKAYDLINKLDNEVMREKENWEITKQDYAERGQPVPKELIEGVSQKIQRAEILRDNLLKMLEGGFTGTGNNMPANNAGSYDESAMVTEKGAPEDVNAEAFNSPMNSILNPKNQSKDTYTPSPTSTDVDDIINALNGQFNVDVNLLFDKEGNLVPYEKVIQPFTDIDLDDLYDASGNKVNFNDDRDEY